MRQLLSCTILALSISLPAAAVEIPDAIAARGEIPIATAHAVGAQVYECVFDTAGNLAWQFREPIATMVIDGKTVGQHYAGPTWEMADGSTIRAKVAARAPSAGPGDIPLLKLDVTSWTGNGQLSHVTTIQRLNTHGGNAESGCDRFGALLSVPYSADYAFYRKAD